MKELSLEPRQTQIVRLVALGMTNAQISRSLGIQAKTVENYLTVIYQKTSANNRTELVSVLSN
ncbi:MAG: helix-turn-helix transcriptional regulator [Proteobacteria bacterium]|nr:helix-turn-helix transcriptional regulator [Pseudomonadota bacterium]